MPCSLTRVSRSFLSTPLSRLRANALYQDVYPLRAALSRPLIGHLLVRTAGEYSATAVAHGCTGKGNDQVRIELAVRALDPSLTVERRCASLRSRDPTRSRSPANTTFRSRIRQRSPIRSTPISGGVRLKPACSKTRGTRHLKMRSRGRRRRRRARRRPKRSSSHLTAVRPSIQDVTGAEMVAALNDRSAASTESGASI